MKQEYCVYIMTNKTNRVLYAGITSHLKKRIYEHREKLIEGFTKKYHINKLVYYEVYEDPVAAIAGEKRIKGGSRRKKMDLIMKINPSWDDLYDKL